MSLKDMLPELWTVITGRFFYVGNV